MFETSSRYELGYSKNDGMISEPALQVLQNAVMSNNAVGSITGYYDESLSILTVSEILLGNLGYTLEEFMTFTKGSLKNLFYGENRTFLENSRFSVIKGMGEGSMLTKDGTPLNVKMFKDDSVDKDGKRIWIMSVRVNWEHENITLINDALKSGFWYFDCNEKNEIINVHWSHAFRKMLGFHDILDFPNDLSSWTSLLHPDDSKKTFRQLSDAMSDKTGFVKYDVEYRMKMLDGSYQWFRAKAEIIRRIDGTVRRIAGIFINIDEEKKAQMQAKKADAFHHAFTETNLCEYYVDLKRNTFDSLKNEGDRLVFDEKIRNWDELVDSYAKKYVCKEYQKGVKIFFDREYIMRQLSGVDEGQLYFECSVCLNGEVRWIRNVIFKGEKLGERYALVFVSDITEAKNKAEIQKQITAENESLGLLVQSVTKLVDQFAVCDLQKDSYEYFMIKTKSEYPKKGKYSELIKTISSKLKTLPPLDELEKIISPENLRKKIRDSNALYKFDYCSKDESFYRSATFIPLKWEKGELSQVLMVSIDITKSKLMENESRKALTEAYLAADRANRAKTEFLTNMSHDIRTPMNAIVGLTAIAVANIEQKDKVLDCFEKITKSSRHLLGLINEVLDMARIESGKISLDEELFNLPELVDNLVSLAKTGIDEHKHHFDIRIKNIKHENVYGDVMRLQQVFTNLLSNAIKYTPDGGKITFSIEEKDSGRQGFCCYEFIVQDNGVGMDEDFQKVIFQPFVRADDKRTSKVMGTGLGMTITKNIVDMMNGDIRVESKLNKGTKITVTLALPLRDCYIDDSDGFKNISVLVVDDDDDTCKSTLTTLEEIGIRGEWVSSGAEAVKLVSDRHSKNEDYFAVILDWKMPYMDGMETARQIKRITGSNVKLVVMTAYDYSQIEGEANEIGIDGFISKPLFRSRLSEVFRKIKNNVLDTPKMDYLKEIKKADFSGAKVLLVEDNDLNSQIATEIIEMTKAKVDVAKNGREAVEKVLAAKENQYDIVFMDIQMPVMNGYEATAAIRNLSDDNCSKVPIVAMTANAFVEDVQHAKNTGMNDHIAKPLDVEKLYKVMSKFLA